MYSPAKSARNAFIDEIKGAPKSLVREAHDFILFLKQRRSLEREEHQAKVVSAKPDFLARQHAWFEGRVLPDSQAIQDEL